jgi:hypothetical protein
MLKQMYFICTFNSSLKIIYALNTPLDGAAVKQNTSDAGKSITDR